MSQNIYDNPNFFRNYSQLDRQVKGLDGAPEWESVKTLLPDLKGKHVVDLGCGFGWFARYAMTQGAVSALGIDLSENMIERAKQDTSDPAITYQIADLEEIELPTESFNFAYSSLTFHYIKDFRRLVTSIHNSLTPGSDFVFTIEHPIYMSPSHPDYIKDQNGNNVWPLDQYLLEGERTTDWLAPGVIKQHRTLGTTINTLISEGFSIQHVEEWKPSDEQLQQHPDWKVELNRPMFLIVSAQKEA